MTSFPLRISMPIFAQEFLDESSSESGAGSSIATTAEMGRVGGGFGAQISKSTSLCRDCGRISESRHHRHYRHERGTRAYDFNCNTSGTLEDLLSEEFRTSFLYELQIIGTAVPISLLRVARIPRAPSLPLPAPERVSATV